MKPALWSCIAAMNSIPFWATIGPPSILWDLLAFCLLEWSFWIGRAVVRWLSDFWHGSMIFELRYFSHTVSFELPCLLFLSFARGLNKNCHGCAWRLSLCSWILSPSRVLAFPLWSWPATSYQSHSFCLCCCDPRSAWMKLHGYFFSN